MPVSFRRRFFLNPESTGHTAHILAEVESSSHGRHRWGTSFLTIADCRRSITLEFELDDAASRKQSFQKLDLLIRVLTQFRKALKAEATLIEKTTKTRPPKN